VFNYHLKIKLSKIASVNPILILANTRVLIFNFRILGGYLGDSVGIMRGSGGGRKSANMEITAISKQ
jgi:hypothetical protein